MRRIGGGCSSLVGLGSGLVLVRVWRAERGMPGDCGGEIEEQVLSVCV